MNPRPYRDKADKARMLALAWLGDTLHAVDMPYRLSSWAFDHPESVALWEDGGELIAWVGLQAPFWAIDYAMHPAAPPEMLADMLAWADLQALRLPAPYGRPTWFMAVPESRAAERRTLEAAGFVDQSVAAEPWSQVLFRHDGDPAPAATPRGGFTIRPLRGADEVAAYVALHREVFGTTNMTEAWRAATLRAPGYRPEFDLVATGPAGELVGFAIGWYREAGGRAVAQVEPFGVRADARRYGLAWALMLELLRRFQAAGAGEVRVMTDNYRDAAYAFYKGCGFQVAEKVLMYRKDYYEESL